MTPPSNNNAKRKGLMPWIVGHSVTANLVMLVLLVGGLYLGFKIKKEVFPQFELDRVNITVPYPGAKAGPPVKIVLRASHFRHPIGSNHRRTGQPGYRAVVLTIPGCKIFGFRLAG